MTKPHNPWEEFLNNCATGDNHFRSSEYQELIDFIDGIQAENAALAGTKLYPRPDPRVAELEGIIRHASQVKTLDDNLIAELETQIAKLTRQRDEAVQMLADWCDVVRDDGTGLDDWDEHYKVAAWRQCGIRELIDAARTTEGETE